MKRSLLILSFLCVGVIKVFSQPQPFYASEINTSRFPRLSSYVSLVNENISEYDDKDFVIFENGVEYKGKLEFECSSNIEYPPLNLILMLDNSKSMYDIQDGATESMKNHLIAGARKFIDGFNFDNGSQMEIIVFSTNMRQLVPFTNDREYLKNRVDSIIFGGSTNFDAPFLHKDNGAIKRFASSTPDSIRRAIIIVSDGAPDGEFHWREIAEECRKLNITVYSVILNHDPQIDEGDLFRLPESTDGKMYAAKNTDELYTALIDAVNKKTDKKMCRLIWTTNYACSESDNSRDIVISFQPAKISVQRKYSVPQSGIIHKDYYDNRLFFNVTEIGGIVEKELTIIPQKTGVQLLSYQIKPSKNFEVLDWDANKPGVQDIESIFIEKNKPHRVLVRFTKTEDVPYVIGTLVINAEPCDMRVELIGGLAPLKITSPLGGEIYSYCDKVKIAWVGRKEDDGVDLYYKTPEASSWVRIVTNYKADTITWTPPKVHENYQFRVSSVANGSINWSSVFGSDGEDRIEGLAIDESGENLYIIGTHTGNFSIGDQEISHLSKKDAFLLCFDEFGHLKWHKELLGPDDDEITDCCIDDEGNICIVGKMIRDSRLAGLSPSISSTNRFFAFTAKFNKDGNQMGLFAFDPRKNNPGFSSEGHSIVFNKDDDNYTVYCGYSGEYMYDGVTLRDTKSGLFVFSLDKSMVKASNIKYGILKNHRSDSYSVKDASGNQYLAEVFSGTTEVNGKEYVSKGATDIRFLKKTPPKTVIDILEQSIAVRPMRPLLEIGGLDFGALHTGKSVSQSFPFITNEGDIPLKIESINIDNSQFTIDVPNGTVIEPNHTLNCKITYSPTNFGKVNTNMSIFFNCHDNISVSFKGEGLCSFEAKSMLDMGNVVVNKTVNKTFESVITNNELDSFLISAKIVGADSQFFKIISPTAGTKVKPGESIPVKVEFSPTYDREYIAYIEYTANAGCTGNNTKLIAKGVSGDMTLSNIDFGSHRLGSKTTKDGQGNEAVVTISNVTEFPVELISLELENEADFKAKGFELLTPIPDIPLVLNGNESYTLKFAFSPKSEESVSSKLIVKISTNEKAYTANLRGEGFLPKFKYAWECPPPVNPGSSSIGEFVIDITDSKSDVFIKNIKFKKGDEYKLTGSVNDLTLSKKKNRYIFQVEFTPQSSGMINDELIITSDALASAEGKPHVDSTYSIECEAKGNAYDTKLNFDNTIICGQSNKSIYVENKSKSIQLQIVSAKINDANGVFSANTIVPVTIEPSSRIEISIAFAPKEKKKYMGELVLKTDDGQTLSCQLLGEGEEIALYTNPKQLDVDPGNTFQVPIMADIPATNDTQLSSISFIVKFNPAMFILDKKKPIETKLAGVNWKETKLAHGHHRFDSEGNIALPISQNEIATLKFFSALGDTNMDEISIKYFVNSCEIATDKLFSVKLNPVCLDSVRRVQFYDSKTKIASIYPNPINDVLCVDYSLGIEAPVIIEIYNELGNVVMTLVNEKQKAGNYTIKQPLGDLSSGVYYLRLKQSGIVKIRKLNVIR